MAFRETLSRSVLKALSWRIIGTIVTASLVYVVTGRWLLALGVGGFEGILKLGFYFVHERVWNMIRVGKEHSREDETR